MRFTLKYIQCVVLIAGWMLSPGIESTEAAISFVPITWDSGRAGWTNSNASVASVDNVSGQLNMHFNGLGSPGWQSDTVAMTSVSQPGYFGDYSAYQNLQVAFNFQGYATTLQSLYFESTAGGLSTWVYDFTVPDSSLHNYTVSLSNPAGWTRLSGSSSFATALTSVDSIGITVGHMNFGSPLDYYLDDWTYSDPVPEPGTIAMLFSALGSLGIVCKFRRRQARPVPGKV